jgi:hypothetical protein
MNFISRGVWEKVKREKVKALGRKPSGTKCVFKIKVEQDGSKQYKSRCVTLGYLQIPGVDFTETFSPVASDSTIRIALGVFLYKEKPKSWVLEMIDIEAAFLEADQDRPVYIEWPEGMTELGFISKDDAEEYCCELNKAMYGNVDAPLQWMKTFANFLTSDVMDMKQSLADPCMFYKKDGKNDLVLLAVVFVDDVLLGGTEKMVKWFKTKISTRFNFTDLGKLRKHLGVWYEWGRDENGDTFIKATMDLLIDKTIEAFRNVTGHYASAVSMPAYPGKVVLQKHKGEEPVMLDKFRSLTGKIMYVAQKHLPVIANAARKLAQHMLHPGEEHWKALECLVGYLGTTKGKGLIYQRPKELQLVSWADSNYATNEDTR